MSYESEEATDGGERGRTVVALFSHRDRAHEAMRALRYAGFGDDRVGIATRDGGALVTVQAGGRMDEAQSILRSHGADLDPMGMADQVSQSVAEEDRRYGDDLTYAGPERRLAEV